MYSGLHAAPCHEHLQPTLDFLTFNTVLMSTIDRVKVQQVRKSPAVDYYAQPVDIITITVLRYWLTGRRSYFVELYTGWSP